MESSFIRTQPTKIRFAASAWLLDTATDLLTSISLKVTPWLTTEIQENEKKKSFGRLSIRQRAKMGSRAEPAAVLAALLLQANSVAPSFSVTRLGNIFLLLGQHFWLLWQHFFASWATFFCLLQDYHLLAKFVHDNLYAEL